MENRKSKRLNKHNLNDFAYTRIKEDIISCELLPGVLISENLIIDRYGLSKSPTRSALMRLKQEGLITSRGQKGSMVARIMINDVQEIFQIRLLVEVTVARLAAGKVNAKKLRELNKDINKISKSNKKNKMAEYLRANRKFHEYVSESSGNQRLADLAKSFMEQHERIMHLGFTKKNRRKDFIHFHDDFVEALINDDGNFAAKLVETSLIKGQEKVMRTLIMGDTDQISSVGKKISLE